MKEILINAALYAILILLLCPVTGAFINWMVLGVLRSIFRLFDKRGRSFVIFLNVITFLGVIHHELSHALFAFVTGAKIKKIDLYKVRAGSLGSVSYVPRGPLLFRSLQMSVSSAAPVFMGFITEALLIMKLLEGRLHPALLLLLCFLILSILVHMDMSTQDIMVYIKGVPMCFLLLAAIFVVVLEREMLPILIPSLF